MPRFLLLWAAVPALVLGVWLLRVGGAPRSVQALQVAVAIVAAAAFAGLVGVRRAKSTANTEWIALALASSLFIPLLSGSQSSPERWLVFGSTRLYVAPAVLPLTLFLLGAPVRVPAINAASVVAAATALVLQPDAAQLSAFALAMLVLLATANSHRLLGLTLAAVLMCSAVVAWRTPDPLGPVRYVEGVFNLAAERSPFALLAAVSVAALPVLAFVWVARVTRSMGAGATAVYYACLFALAPLQVTPVPLLGFGTGPVLGYFLVASVASRAFASPSRFPRVAVAERDARVNRA